MSEFGAENGYCKDQARRTGGWLLLKRPELPCGFQAKVFKDSVREEGHRMHDQFMDLLLIGWW